MFILNLEYLFTFLQGASKGLTTIQEFTSQEFGFVNITRFGVLGGSKVCALSVCVSFFPKVGAHDTLATSLLLQPNYLLNNID